MRAKKRQKLYRRVQKKSDARQKTAETVQPCKGTVAKRRNSGKNFTRAQTEAQTESAERQVAAESLQGRTNGANRKRKQSTEPEETAESLHGSKGTVGYAAKGGRKFTRADKRSEQKAQAEYGTRRNGKKFTAA
ncbi:hypothetical protein [Gardnerella sp. DNF00983]|uniref:hypothetical protein n=1 Tax=Gardnerella sp. DNF00983 TaxID=2749056 RepID=UPI003BACDC6A